MSLTIRILGPVELLDDGRVAPLGPPKRRLMLAALALEANHAVSLPRLVETIWPVAAPLSAVANLRSHAAELRRHARGRLAASGGGYQLSLDDGELDVAEFARLTRDGRRALTAGEPAAATATLAAALGLWRGAPLGGLEHGEALAARLRSLQEQRLEVFEDYVEARIAAGAATDAVADLRAHLQAYPLRERAWGQLMLALYRGGNVAAALDAFALARTALAEHLGIDPGPELSALHRAILDRDLDLEPAERPVLPRRFALLRNAGPAYAWPAS